MTVSEVRINPVQTALWYVESHSQDAISLDRVARECRVSAYHLTRAFTASTGMPLMRYVRGRRLSDAARLLAGGAEDILDVALQAGYGSHEAFTRAFREHFGLTPEQLRARGGLSNLELVEAISMQTTPVDKLIPPTFETLRPMRVAGIVERYDCQEPAGIPSQWQRFNQHFGHIPGQVGKTAYGVCYNFDSDGNFDYMCAAEISGAPELPEGFITMDLPAQKYVVFKHPTHVAGIRGTFAAIWSKWFPESGFEAVEAPTLECYGPEFDPSTGLGGIEIRIAIR